MAIWFAGIVACEEYVEAGDIDEEHGGAEDVPGWVRGDADGGDGMGCVEVDGFDLVERGDVVLFGVEGGTLIGGGRSIGHSDRVLDQPFVDGFGWVGHEDSAFEIGFCKDVREGGCMVEMETERFSVSFATEEERMAARANSRDRCLTICANTWDTCMARLKRI